MDEIRIAMDAGQEGLAHHFIPARKNNRLVILHHGHACTLNDSSARADVGFGIQRTINALLHDGYSVVGMYMPHQTPDDCDPSPDVHNDMFKIVTTGSPMKFFLEPVAVSLNYLKTQSSTDNFPQYREFHMAGLSGGGWTTTVYAAIDPTIKFSFPVAGTIPLYLRFGGSVGDKEQWFEDFYRIAGYPDLYIMGSYGSGRKQVQILNRHDGCCFGEGQHDAAATGMSYAQAMRNYEAQVRQVMFALDSGAFRLEIDEAAPSHMISHNSIVNITLSELNHGRRYIGASTSTDAFVRGMNGHLWHHGPVGWEDTGFAMVGVPAVLQGIANDFDVFFRDPGNLVKHAYRTGSGWAIQNMPGGIVTTDPVATSWGPGRFDVVALGGNYKLYHWWWSGGAINLEEVSSTAKGLGPSALVTWGVNRLDIFFRGWDRAVYEVERIGAVDAREGGRSDSRFSVCGDYGWKHAAGLCPRTKQATLGSVADDRRGLALGFAFGRHRLHGDCTLRQSQRLRSGQRCQGTHENFSGEPFLLHSLRRSVGLLEPRSQHHGITDLNTRRSLRERKECRPVAVRRNQLDILGRCFRLIALAQ